MFYRKSVNILFVNTREAEICSPVKGTAFSVAGRSGDSVVAGFLKTLSYIYLLGGCCRVMVGG